MVKKEMIVELKVMETQPKISEAQAELFLRSLNKT
jgi:hypothetical protein